MTSVDLALAGLGLGAVAALAGLGVLVTYRIVGVFNVAFGAVAALAAELLREAVRQWGVPVLPAATLIVLVVCPALGTAVWAVVFRPLEHRRAGTGETLVASVGLLVVLIGAITVVWGAQAWPDAPSLFPAGRVRLPFGATVRADSVAALAVVAAIGLAAAGLLRTRVGLIAKAVVADRDLAELAGIDTDRVSMLAWAVGWGLAGLAGVLIAPSTRLDPYGLTLVVLGTMAVPVIARLRDPVVAVVAALAIAVLQAELTQFAFHGEAGTLLRALSSNLFAVALLVALLVMRGLPGGDETRPFTVRLARRHELRPPSGWWVPTAAVLALPLVLSGPDLRAAQRVPALALVLLSIVVLSGYTGQISLGQAGFAGLGALVVAHLVDGDGLPFALPPLVALPVAVALTGLVGSLLARPAIRRRGLYLALTTFAIGVIISRFIFAEPRLVRGLAIAPPPPFDGDRGFYVLEVALLSLGLLVVRWHHRGRLGRSLLALRDDEGGAEAAGVDSHRLRIWAFGIGTGLAALGGALLAASDRAFDASTFDPIQSLIWFAAVAVAGIDSATGAVIVAGLVVLLDVELGSGTSTFVIGLAAIALGSTPGGLVYQARRALSLTARLWAPPTAPAPATGPIQLSPAGRALAARVRR